MRQGVYGVIYGVMALVDRRWRAGISNPWNRPEDIAMFSGSIPRSTRDAEMGIFCYTSDEINSNFPVGFWWL